MAAGGGGGGAAESYGHTSEQDRPSLPSGSPQLSAPNSVPSAETRWRGVWSPLSGGLFSFLEVSLLNTVHFSLSLAGIPNKAPGSLFLVLFLSDSQEPGSPDRPFLVYILFDRLCWPLSRAAFPFQLCMSSPSSWLSPNATPSPRPPTAFSCSPTPH